MVKTWIQAVYYRSHQTKQPSSLQPPTSQRGVKKTATDVILEERLFPLFPVVHCFPRHGDLDEFFQYENQTFPPSLPQMGSLRTGTKSVLIICLENPAPMKDDLDPLPCRVQVKILDDAGIVNMLRPGTAKTFQTYATDVLCRMLHPSSRMKTDLTSFGISTWQTA